MRILNLIVLASALALPYFSEKVRAAELESEQAALEECAAYSQAGMRECLAKKSSESNAALKRAQKQAIAAVCVVGLNNERAKQLTKDASALPSK